MILEIIKGDDSPVLRRRAREVRKIGKGILRLLDDLLETMREAQGLGLAAPQVGVSKRVIVCDVGEGPIKLINPVVVRRSGSAVAWEGCLSVPGLLGEVERAEEVTVKGLNPEGRETWIDASGLLARVLQHEIDHLDGILFLDRARRVVDEEEFERPSLSVVFMGTPDFAVPSLERLAESSHRILAVVTQPDRPAGRGKRPTPPPIKRKAEELGLTVLQPESIKEPSFLTKLKELEPDVVVCVAFGQIFPAALLNLPPHGCINLHASLLPEYRGAAPIHRAIMDGRERSGVTTMIMSPGLDKGDIILQEEMDIGPDETAGSLHDRMARVGAELLVRTLDELARGEAKPKPQDESRASYAPPLKREDEIIDWGRSAREVHNQVRGLAPWPGAFTYLRGRLLKVWAGRILSERSPARARSGQVIGIEEDGPVINCGEGTYLLLEVQPENGRRMTARDFLNGYELHVGDVLGSAQGEG